MDESSYGQLLNFKGNEIYILENEGEYKKFSFEFPKTTIAMDKKYYEGSDISNYVKDVNDLAMLKIQITNNDWKAFHILLQNDKLIVQWSTAKVSIYERADVSNSMELLTQNLIKDFEPVKLNYYRLADNPERTSFLLMDKNGKMYMDNKPTTLDKLEQRLSEEILKGGPFESVVHFLTLNIDARCTMKSVWQLLDKMRDINQLLHILSGAPLDNKVPEIFYHNIGIPRRLPPKNDPFYIEISEDMIADSNLVRFDLTKDKISFDDLRTQLNQKIQRNPQYIIILKYDNKVQYNDYLSSIDLVYQVIYDKRNQVAQQKYNLNYDDLATTQQQEIQRSYPIRLSEKNIDQPED